MAQWAQGFHLPVYRGNIGRREARITAVGARAPSPNPIKSLGWGVNSNTSQIYLLGVLQIRKAANVNSIQAYTACSLDITQSVYTAWGIVPLKLSLLTTSPSCRLHCGRHSSLSSSSQCRTRIPGLVREHRADKANDDIGNSARTKGCGLKTRRIPRTLSALLLVELSIHSFY